MSSTFMILLAIYLFQFATNINDKYVEANFYKGLLAVASLLCLLVSFCIELF